MKTRAKAGALDKVVGGNLRRLRQKNKKSLVYVGGVIDVSYQQVMKVEHGINKISASALYKIATALEENMYDFFTPLYDEKKDD